MMKKLKMNKLKMNKLETNKLKRFFHDSRGQGMTEYIIIVALIAIATIGAVTVFGNNVRGLFQLSTDALNGEKELKAEKYTEKSGGEEKRKRSLSDLSP